MTQRILILNLTRMGDLIQSTPLLAGLRKKHPHAKIVLAVSSDFAEFASRIPDVDEIVVFNLRQFNERQSSANLSWVEVYRYLGKFLDDLLPRRFDMIVNLSHSKLSALMISYLGIKEVRGFACHETGDRKTFHPWMQYFGTEPFNRAFNSYNLVDIFARSGDVTPDGQGVRIVAEPGDDSLIAQKAVEENIQDGDFLVGIQAGSSLEGRRWPAKSFAELADSLVKNLNAKIVLFGVASESGLAGDIVSVMENKSRVVDLTGKTKIPELIAWLRKCRYLVTNDTGTMHVAAALGIKIAGLFFAHAHPHETAPYGPGHVIFQARIPCAPCSYGVQCNNIVCVQKVRPWHLYSMISRHKDKGAWELPENMGNLDEVNIFQTGFDRDNLLRLKPLIKRPLSLNDVFVLAYRKMWLKSLAENRRNPQWEKSELDNIVGIAREDYDAGENSCSPSAARLKLRPFYQLRQLGERGGQFAEQIVRAFERKPVVKEQIQTWSDGIDRVDERIAQLGLTYPEAKLIPDMFNKRKENLEGNDVLSLARTTRTFYLKLIDECSLMIEAVLYTADTLETRLDSNFTEEASSIKVAVPGK